MHIKIKDASFSKREKDANGYLIIRNNPIAKAGVFDYLLSEIKGDINPKDDKIIKVYRPFNELVEVKDTFANKPIKFNHKWVGEETNVADGAIGSVINVDSKNNMLTADLIIYNPQLIEAIEKNNIVELSPAYTGTEKEISGRYNGEDYAYIQKIECVNHLAVVDKGRSGRDLKIQDSNIIIKEFEKMKNNFKEGFLKHIKKYLDNEAETLKDSTQEENFKDDKREIIREIMAIASKDDAEFSGGENEKIETIAKLAEKLAYQNNTQDNEAETLKDSTQDNEAETLKDSTQDNEAETLKDSTQGVSPSELAEAVAEVTEAIIEKKLTEYTDAQAKELKKINDTYAKVSEALGTSFDYRGMSPNDIYKFGYEALSGEALGNGLEPMTAFTMATQTKRVGVKKFQDNKTSSNILKILKDRY